MPIEITAVSKSYVHTRYIGVLTFAEIVKRVATLISSPDFFTITHILSDWTAAEEVGYAPENTDVTASLMRASIPGRPPLYIAMLIRPDEKSRTYAKAFASQFGAPEEFFQIFEDRQDAENWLKSTM